MARGCPKKKPLVAGPKLTPNQRPLAPYKRILLWFVRDATHVFGSHASHEILKACMQQTQTKKICLLLAANRSMPPVRGSTAFASLAQSHARSDNEDLRAFSCQPLDASCKRVNSLCVACAKSCKIRQRRSACFQLPTARCLL